MPMHWLQTYSGIVLWVHTGMRVLREHTLVPLLCSTLLCRKSALAALSLVAKPANRTEPKSAAAARYGSISVAGHKPRKDSYCRKIPKSVIGATAALMTHLKSPYFHPSSA